MSIEEVRNRDLFFKICFMYFLIHILRILGIKEEIQEILPTEVISMEIRERIKIFDNFLDFAVLTKSGKIMVFEFKKNPITTKDIKQVYDYCDRVHCKKKRDVIAIIIVVSKMGKIKDYTKLDITFHPKIYKTKNISKKKDLKIMRKKFKLNKKLTSEECSLLVAMPLFEFDELESDVVEEFCSYIDEKSDCICQDEIDGIIMGMYLNILEYIDDEDKREELMELIGVTEEVEGVFAQLRKEAKEEVKEEVINEVKEEVINEVKEEVIDEVKEEVKRDFINGLLKRHTLEEVSDFSGMKIPEILSILAKLD